MLFPDRLLRGLFSSYSDDPVVALHSTSGFTLSPRFAGSTQVFNTCSEPPEVYATDLSGAQLTSNPSLRYTPVALYCSRRDAQYLRRLFHVETAEET